MIKHESNPLYSANVARYAEMQYQRCGKSGVRLPRLSLGLWQNFGAVDSQANSRAMIRKAFDLGITHFDLANNYGPNAGSAEQTFGAIFKQDLTPYRDEIIVASKAGFDMWPGPYGIGGSRKYLVASCDQSLKRTGLDYFDIFYHHVMDAETPLEETVQALDFIVRSGRALYVGLSNYLPDRAKAAIQMLRELGIPVLIFQPPYNLFNRRMEGDLSTVLGEEGVGAIVYSPLAQGLLTNKYLQGIPRDSRAARPELLHLKESDIQPEKLAKIAQLNEIAVNRGQSLAQMALAWTLNNPVVTSCIIGASRPTQIEDSVGALKNLAFSAEELAAIDAAVA